MNVLDAWKAYLAERANSPISTFGWNPQRVFEAGYAAGVAAAEKQVTT